MIGHNPPLNVYSHIIGVDIVRVERERVLRAGGQSPHALRRLLHAGEPRDDDASLPGALRQPSRRADRAISGAAAAHPAGGRAARLRRRSEGRGADPRHLQLGLLRALLPRRPDGRRARRGAGSLRRGRLPLHAHDAGARAARRDLPAHRRQLSRPAHLQLGLDARRARPDGPLPRRPRHHRQRAGQRHRRRQGGLRLRAGDHPVLHRPAADPAERADLALLDSRRSSPRARTSGGAGREGGARLRRLRHAGRPDREPARRSRFFATSSRRGRRTTSPSRRWRSPPVRP